MTLDPLPQEGQDFRPVIMLLLVVFAGASFWAALLVGAMVRKPINTLLLSMDQNVGGVLEDAPSGSQIDEFERLTDGYNRLLGRIRTLMADTIKGQELLREKELALLFAQLKPHFLYNTLDSLSALALLGRNQDLHRMVSALASFYRLSLSGGQEVIPLGEDLAIIRNYETIQRIRYDDLFKIVYRVPAEAMGIPVPRLLLQPLVENALYHGIRPSGHKGSITIRASLEGGHLTLEVEDDGVGIDRVRGDELTKAAEEGKGGLGLRATLHRIKVLYGPEGSVALGPREPQGTRVTVVLPQEDSHGLV